MYSRNTHRWLKHIDFILLDCLVLEISFFLAYFIRHGEVNPPRPYYWLALYLLVSDFLVAILFNTMHNVLKRGNYEEFVCSIRHVFLVLFSVIVLLFAIHDEGLIFSRITITLSTLLYLLFGYTTRNLWKKVVPRKKEHFLLVSDEDRLNSVKQNELFSGLVLTNRDGTGEIIDGLQVKASLQTAAEYICREWIDEVFIYPNSLIEDVINERGFFDDDFSEFMDKDYQLEFRKGNSELAVFIEQCREMSVPVHIRIPGIDGKSIAEKINGEYMITTASAYASPVEMLLKRVIDIFGGLIGSVIAVFVILITGPMIVRASPGPVLFRQKRVGRNGKIFTCYKLRTMRVGADREKENYQNKNQISGPMFKLDWDPRVIGNEIVNGEQKTGIGEKLRKGSWDEWPQFFNVLMGQMSLVGTRPPTVDEWENYELHHRARMSMKPGITGLWQVSGRSDIKDFEEVVRLDIEYINNWSLGLDFRILLKTLKVIREKKGAV